MAKNKGQFIVEGMVAMGLIVSSVLGIFSLAVSSLKIGNTVTDSFIAANLAAEGLEITKNILDSNVINNKAWNYGLTNGTYEADYLSVSLKASEAKFLNSDNSGFYSYKEGTATKFKRTIEIDNKPSGNEIQAIAKVFWTDRTGPQQIEIATEFLRWR